MESLAWTAAVVIAYGAVSRRMAASVVTAPMVFVAVGMLLGPAGLQRLDLGFDDGGVRILAEATLALVLFVDATALDVRRLTREVQLPLRLLLVGLPGTVTLGALAAWVLFDGFGIWSAALLAAVLAPTDAALGQAVVANGQVPERIRDTLTVESGLNDGLALPLVTLFLGLAEEAEGTLAGIGILGFIGEQVGWGLAAGVAVGLVGGGTLSVASKRGWIDGLFRQLSTLAVAVLAFALAEAASGNGFIAAFTAGLAFAWAARDHCDHVADFAEDEGQLLAMLTFLVFGSTLAGPALADLSSATLAYAVASLTLVRMLPTAIALVGTGLDLRTVGFVGWFGPRGLASILFAVLVVEEGNLPLESEVVTIVTWTVLLSVYAHGLSARPVARAYARRVDAMSPDRPEHDAAPRR